MNTYNDNLQVTVEDILTDLQSKQTMLNSQYKNNEYVLYYAQGATIKAQERLDKVVDAYEFARKVDEEGVENNNQAVNLLATSTHAGESVASSVTNAATAASNVQIAANAISKLAADIGSAFNVSYAADYGTDIYELGHKTNEFIRHTAYRAERASQLAMEATTETSEVIASQLLADSTQAKSDIDNLLKATQAEFTKLTTTRAADNAALASAFTAERVAKGVYLDSLSNAKAINAAYDNISKKLNYNLQVATSSSSSINIKYSQYRQPFPATDGDGKKSYAIPSASPKYYAVIVPDDHKLMFNLDKAKLLFTNYKESRFIELNKSGSKGVSDNGKSDHWLTHEELIKVKGVSDSEGKPVTAGAPYVVFLYIEVSLDYKKYIDSLSDFLSAFSTTFTLTTELPAAINIEVALPDEDKNPPANTAVSVNNVVGKIQFEVPFKPVNGIEYRCMLLPEGTPGIDRLLTAVNNSEVDSRISLNTVQSRSDKPLSSLSKKGEQGLGFYFNLDIAQLVTPSNYTLANMVKDQEIGKDSLQFYSDLTVETTDNFGDDIQPGKKYIPVVLSIVPDNITDYKNYTSVISDISSTDVITVPDFNSQH